MRARQRGAVGAALAVVLILVLGVALAGYVLRRVSESSDDATQTGARLATAAEAIEAFAAAQRRLPCPAQPDADTGAEAPSPPVSTCTYPEGTIPWLTIGLKREAALDPWGRKISYRVYTGAAGSLVQPNGVSMVECDTVEVTSGAANAAGLCTSVGTDVTSRSTTPAGFLAGKGLTVTDMGVARSDAAYVLVSHGATGLGGYTSSGARLDLPVATSERNNTLANGPFTIQAESDPDKSATSGNHFDDLLAYRRLSDLVQRIGLQARDWFDVVQSVRFDAPTVSAALGGGSVSPGSTGRVTINFLGAVVSGVADTSTPSEITYDTVGGTGGLGIAGGGSNLIQSSANEFLRISFTHRARRFGITLADFGYYGNIYVELAQLRFYLGGTAVGTSVLAIGCKPDGGITSFTVPVDTFFDRVEIAAYPSAYFVPPSYNPGPPGISAFLVAEVKACDSTTSECRTSIDAPGNQCGVL